MKGRLSTMGKDGQDETTGGIRASTDVRTVTPAGLRRGSREWAGRLRCDSTHRAKRMAGFGGGLGWLAWRGYEEPFHEVQKGI